MFREKETIEALSLICTHYIYRNTSLEKYHCNEVIMDEALYKTMHRIVARNLNYVKQFFELDLTICNEADFKRVAYSLNPYIGRHFVAFFGEFSDRYGSEWSIPKELGVPDTRDYAAYVLSGKFAECCRDGVQLNDTTMCIINKDVHNRIYTLLKKGLL